LQKEGLPALQISTASSAASHTPFIASVSRAIAVRRVLAAKAGLPVFATPEQAVEMVSYGFGVSTSRGVSHARSASSCTSLAWAKLLRRLGYRKLSVRPLHPQTDLATQEAFKTSPTWRTTRFAGLGRNRRLAKDFEKTVVSAEAWALILRHPRSRQRARKRSRGGRWCCIWRCRC